jgi:hypothetical protein
MRAAVFLATGVDFLVRLEVRDLRAMTESSQRVVSGYYRAEFMPPVDETDGQSAVPLSNYSRAAATAISGTPRFAA